MKKENILVFPKDFVWGTATASYQIEGAVAEDGRKPSIWDTFSHTKGKVIDGSTGDVACDHYHRYQEDIALMAKLGYPNYRFSLAWPRIIPEGKSGASGAGGGVNEKGLDFYSRLVDTLLEHSITPYATFFHWDLPQALQDAGGWANRDTAYYYRDYVAVVLNRLGDRVKHWMTHNEPWVHSFVGNIYGEHAPGNTDLALGLQVAHHVLLSHGLAVPLVKEHGGNVGIVHNLEWVEPASDRACDIEAAKRHDGAFNRWFLDPVFYGKYPQDMMDWYGKDCPKIESGDMRIISAPTDFLGINFYTRRIIADDPQGDFLQVRKVSWPFQRRAQYESWENNAEALYRLLMRVSRDYGNPDMYITENGTPLQDCVVDGAVHDPDRIDYLYRHFAAAYQAIQDGVKLKGYFVWSLMDNFEWNLGTTKRFGLVYVDFSTQQRIVKDSGKWFSEVVRNNMV